MSYLQSPRLHRLRGECRRAFYEVGHVLRVDLLCIRVRFRGYGLREAAEPRASCFLTPIMPHAEALFKHLVLVPYSSWLCTVVDGLASGGAMVSKIFFGGG